MENSKQVGGSPLPERKYLSREGGGAAVLARSTAAQEVMGSQAGDPVRMDRTPAVSMTPLFAFEEASVFFSAHLSGSYGANDGTEA